MFHPTPFSQLVADYVNLDGRAATCLHEKTRLARGHGSFSLESGGKQGRAHTSSNGEDSSDVRDLPQQGDEEVDMTDSDQLHGWHGGHTTRWKR